MCVIANFINNIHCIGIAFLAVNSLMEHIIDRKVQSNISEEEARERDDDGRFEKRARARNDSDDETFW